ncbi:ABC-2 type transport system ATP-binding protein [Microbacterium sp. W4I4]|uniref:ATP-binding cassette domain-containing protein n=1 Tax=Microbacterium sp. W4I4 TaxID=3042295 RepID=UPI002785ACD7|nr:ATP-binding cassette domain-containing protein [Microbacterium sp. W4I4]MDQ0614984.1 ABC-2 type transport system ATP-binding protein [Microbacterium sp. W4I4]
MPEGQVLEFNRITKRYGAVTAVADLSVRVEPGVVTGFLGPNGAGKTTSLRMLLGQIRPTSGTATIGGSSYSELRNPLRTVGAVLEEAAYRPRRTASRQLLIAAKGNGIPVSRVDEVLRLVGLQEDADTRLGSYSLGMRQRLAVASALLGDPGVLVLDEPANGLDPEGIRWMRLLMRRLADEGRTVLLSSHVLSEIEQVADNVVVLSKGRSVYSGRIEDLADPAGGAVIVDAENRAQLITALSAAKVDFDVLRSGVTVRDSNAAAVGAITAAAGVPLTVLQQRGPSLEDVFLDLVYGRRSDSPRLDQVANPVAHAPLNDGVSVGDTAGDTAVAASGIATAGAAAVVAGGAAGSADAAVEADADTAAPADADADAADADADAADAADAAEGDAPEAGAEDSVEAATPTADEDEAPAPVADEAATPVTDAAADTDDAEPAEGGTDAAAISEEAPIEGDPSDENAPSDEEDADASSEDSADAPSDDTEQSGEDTEQSGEDTEQPNEDTEQPDDDAADADASEDTSPEATKQTDEDAPSEENTDSTPEADPLHAAVANLWNRPASVEREASDDAASDTDDSSDEPVDESPADEGPEDSAQDAEHDAEDLDATRVLPLATEAVSIPAQQSPGSFTELITGIPASASRDDAEPTSPATEAIEVFAPLLSNDDDDDSAVDDAEDNPHLAAMRTSLSSAASRFFDGPAPDYPYSRVPADAAAEESTPNAEHSSDEADQPSEDAQPEDGQSEEGQPEEGADAHEHHDGEHHQG